MFLVENNAILDANLGGKQYGVFFIPKDDSVFSANENFEAVALFDSPVLDGGDNFVSWKEINVNCEQFENNKVYVYIRSSETRDSNAASWIGPILKYSQYDISDIKNKFLQIRLAMTTNSFATNVPKVNSLIVSNFKIGQEEVFYTKLFNLGFKPKHIMLIYNGQISEDVLIRFAITGQNTTDNAEYYDIEPNKILDISEFPISDKIKLMLSGVGNRTIPFVIDEFSFILSGDKQALIQ